MSKSIQDFLKLRMPQGDLYERKKKTKKLLDFARRDSNSELIPWAEYLYASTRDVYYRGGKHYEYSLELLDKHLDVENGMIRVGKTWIPKPKFSELYLLEYEFYDILLPYLITAFDPKYDCFYHEGPYELNSQVSIEENDIVIDCGANMGYFSAIAAVEASNGKIYSFEPTSHVIEQYLSKTISLHNNIMIEKYAVSDQIGEMDIIIDNNNIGAASLVLNNRKSDYETVAVTTLDEFVERNHIQHVSYIKADIEGAERNMLRGAANVLKEFAPKLSICTYHLPDDPQVLERIIKELNPHYVIEHKYKKIYAYCP